MIELRTLNKQLLGRKVVGTSEGKFHVRGRIDKVALGREYGTYYVHYQRFSGEEHHDIFAEPLLKKLLKGERVNCLDAEWSEGRITRKREMAISLQNVKLIRIKGRNNNVKGQR